MYVIKDTKCWEKKKPKKKKLKPPPSPHSQPFPLTFLPPPSWSGPPSAEPREREEARGWCSPGDLLQVPTSSPSAGLGGVSGLFMYLLHTHQPMQVPHPGPSMFLCLCSFPSNSQGFSNPSPTSPGKWDGQGPPCLELAGCPSYRTLPLPASPILFTSHQSELALPGTGRW